MKEYAKSIVALVATLVFVAVLAGCACVGGSKTSYGGAVGALDSVRPMDSDML